MDVIISPLVKKSFYEHELLSVLVFALDLLAHDGLLLETKIDRVNATQPLFLTVMSLEKEIFILAIKLSRLTLIQLLK